MRKKQLFRIKLIVGLSTILILVGGGYLVSRTLFVGTPATQPTAESFQDILAKNCNTSIGKIDIDVVPLKVDWDALKSLGVTKPETFSCGKDVAEAGYTLLPVSGVYVYSMHTVATAFGGTPDPELIGSIIKDDGTVKIVVFLRLGEGPRIVGTLPVVILGEKKLSLTNGEIIYAGYELTAIEPTDPRLVNLLNKHSQPYYKEERELLSTIDRNQLIKNNFFSNLNKLGPSEKKALDEIELVLDAVTAK